MKRINYKEESPQSLLKIIKDNNVEYIRMDNDLMEFHAKREKETLLDKLYKNYYILDLKKDENEAFITTGQTISKRGRTGMSNVISAHLVEKYLKSKEELEHIYDNLKNNMSNKTEDFIGDKIYKNAKLADVSIPPFYMGYAGRDFPDNKMQIFLTSKIGNANSQIMISSFNFFEKKWDSVNLFNNDISNLKLSKWDGEVKDSEMYDDFNINHFLVESLEDEKENKNKKDKTIDSLLNIQKSLLLKNEDFLKSDKEKQILNKIKRKFDSDEKIVQNINEIMEYAKTEINLKNKPKNKL